MTKSALLAASALTMALGAPAWAQEAQAGGSPQDIVVTAQRQSQTLQAVPIAVSAFSAESLEKQQIDNASDLQLTLPNITFTKSNFTGSSFTIRGVGDLCVGTSCDAATAIHLNGTPLLQTRIFETEYFDLERVEVLRGPQGTLFGRNATSGVVNFITAKPRTDKVAASAEVEYGNYDSIRAKAMINLPLTDTLAVRFAGFYLNRDGYTTNVYNNTKIDGRDMYSIRGSLRWEPTIDTTIDIMGSYFREKDDRMRIQKQLCQTDPTGVLGCLNNRLDNGRTNTNSTLAGVFSSQEVFALQGIPSSLGLGSLYGQDSYSGNPTLTDPRQVYTAYTPRYKTDELQLQGRIEHNFGAIKAQLTGFYHETSVDSSQDYNLGVQNRSLIQTGLNNFAAAAAGAYDAALPGLSNYLAPAAKALMPNGPSGPLCVSQPVNNGLGVFGGYANCSNVPLAYDRSSGKTHDWSAEAIISSNFDGKFNFLLGGIYVDMKADRGDYDVNAFGLDYAGAVLGGFSSYANGLKPSYLGTSFYDNANLAFKLRSYGIFGEAYYDVNDRLKLTVGLRYNNDHKEAISRSTLFNFLVPYGQTGSAYDSPYIGSYDADPSKPGNQPTAVQSVGFDRVTGRAVLDYKIDKDHMLYASYSRGYKSGGFNPPLQVVGLSVPLTFAPEQIDAFEIGSKNTFDNGRFTLNLTGFYYKYKGLQLSRIVARTSVNDNVDANIWGLEAEAFFRPARDWSINMSASYLHTEVTSDKYLVNQRDPGGGRSDAVIIKDLANGSNCAVIPTVAGNVAGVNGFVTAVNGAMGLRGPTAFPADGGIASTGAFSVCSALAGAAAGPAGTAYGGIQVLTDGVAVNIKGKELPQAPVVKFSAGIEKTFEFSNGMNIVPRFDITYTGESFGNIFNGRVNRIPGYEVANAQIQLNGTDSRWFLRGFIQNIFNNNAMTGMYLTDQTSGLFTNIFTLEPRRYGIAAGVKF
ncbi:MAG: TonB-dependent receptor [Sphingomonas bacterium]